jgi:hypothetical protein
MLTESSQSPIGLRFVRKSGAFGSRKRGSLASGRRLPIRMGIGVLLFNIPYYLIRPPMEYRYLFLCLRLASENVLSGPGEKESLGPDGNASFVSDRFSGADLGD